MAEFFGSGLHVLTSTITLFFIASARPHAHPPARAFCCVAITLSVPLVSDIGPTVHCVPDWRWVYPWQAGHRSAEATAKTLASFAVGNSTTACSA